MMLLLVAWCPLSKFNWSSCVSDFIAGIIPKNDTNWPLILHYYAIRRAGGNANKRCQPTLAIGHFHCDCVNSKHRSPCFGHTNRPWCNRRWHNQIPVLSHNNNLIWLLARLQNTSAEPEQGEWSKLCCTIIDKPSMSPCISIGSTASQIWLILL